jgi:hypothetical protein
LLAGAGTSGRDFEPGLQHVISITPSTLTGSIATTAATVSVGLNAGGSSLWNIVNWNAMPSNISFSGIVVTSLGVNYTIQYTYDDPNNLPSGLPATAQFPQPFNLSTIANVSTSMDGVSNDPITAWRLLVNSGTGTLRATGIQGGVGSP